MSTAKLDSKKIRRAVQQQAAAVSLEVAVQMMTNLCCLPFWQRVKWAWKVLRGIKISPWEKLKLWVGEKWKKLNAKTNTPSKLGLK